MHRQSITKLFMATWMITATGCASEGFDLGRLQEPDAGRVDTTPVDAGAAAEGTDGMDASELADRGSSPVKDAGSGSVDGGALDSGAATPAEPIVLVRALRLEVHETVDFPLVDERDTTFTILARAVLTIDPNGVGSLKTEFCKFAIDANTRRLQITFPPGSERGFPSVEVGLTLPPLEAGAAIEVPPVTQLAGWRSNNPEGDRLPSDDDDSRVLDSDGDGRPGISVDMSEPIRSKVYVISRTKLRFHGTLVNVDRVEGWAEGTVEQALLGGSSGLVPDRVLRVTPAADQRQNRFLMVSMSGPDGCAEIVAQAATLFR